MEKIRIGSIQKKILILLVGGLSIGLSHNPRRQFSVLKQMGREWEKINKQALERAIRRLYENKLVDYKESRDGTVKIIINDKGKEKALAYKLDEMKVKIPKKWDSKWRIVIFDIPESFKKARNALRFHLKRLGFYQLQKSVFVLPYPCEDEIEFIVELYGVRPYVRQLLAHSLDNELHLKKIFKLG
jgi:DNA-binding transcriptional regulator PaaX